MSIHTVYKANITYFRHIVVTFVGPIQAIVQMIHWMAHPCEGSLQEPDEGLRGALDPTRAYGGIVFVGTPANNVRDKTIPSTDINGRLFHKSKAFCTAWDFLQTGTTR